MARKGVQRTVYIAIDVDEYLETVNASQLINKLVRKHRDNQ